MKGVSKPVQKFEEWAHKIESNLGYSTKDSKPIRDLCDSSRRLIEWSYKVKEREPANYSKIVQRRNKLLLQAGDAIYHLF